MTKWLTDEEIDQFDANEIRDILPQQAKEANRLREGLEDLLDFWGEVDDRGRSTNPYKKECAEELRELLEGGE